MENITPGDIVYLKSEELIDSIYRNYMTVSSYYNDNKEYVWCYWFYQGELREKTLNVASLTKIQ